MNMMEINKLRKIYESDAIWRMVNCGIMLDDDDDIGGLIRHLPQDLLAKYHDRFHGFTLCR